MEKYREWHKKNSIVNKKSKNKKYINKTIHIF